MPAPRAPRAQHSLTPPTQSPNVPTSRSNSLTPLEENQDRRPPKTPNAPSTHPIPINRHDLLLAALAGLFFTADLSIWRWSLRLTTVANSTFVTNLTPFFVTIAAWLLYRERVTPRLLTGLLIAFSGGSLMVAESLHLSPRFLIGDLLALLAAIFYSGYLLVVKQLRRGRRANHRSWNRDRSGKVTSVNMRSR